MSTQSPVQMLAMYFFANNRYVDTFFFRFRFLFLYCNNAVWFSHKKKKKNSRPRTQHKISWCLIQETLQTRLESVPRCSWERPVVSHVKHCPEQLSVAWQPSLPGTPPPSTSASCDGNKIITHLQKVNMERSLRHLQMCDVWMTCRNVTCQYFMLKSGVKNNGLLNEIQEIIHYPFNKLKEFILLKR